MSKHLDSRGRLPQITGQVAKNTAEMLDGLDFCSLSDFLTAASWAYRRGLFQGTFYPISIPSNPVVAAATSQSQPENKPDPKPEIEYTPMFTEDGFDFDDDDNGEEN